MKKDKLFLIALSVIILQTIFTKTLTIDLVVWLFKSKTVCSLVENKYKLNNVQNLKNNKKFIIISQ